MSAKCQQSDRCEQFKLQKPSQRSPTKEPRARESGASLAAVVASGVSQRSSPNPKLTWTTNHNLPSRLVCKGLGGKGLHPSPT